MSERGAEGPGRGSVQGNDPELDHALATRALARAVRASAVSSGALAVLAVAFLALARGALTAQSLPQIVLLGSTWLICALTSVTTARLAHRLGSGLTSPGEASRQAATLIGRAMTAVPIAALLGAVAVLSAVTPRGTTALSVAVSLAIVAQVMFVLLSLRAGLRRTAFRIG